MGTATYFSPEQAQGLPVDARSDVYSLGVVVYEMVCGVPPFSGESPISVAYKHVREEPPRPTVVNPDVPVALENIILTALSKGPESRYASADDMRADLARFRRGEQTSAVPLVAVPVSGADVTVVNPQMDKVYDRTTVGTVVPSPTIPTAPRRSAAPFVLVLIGLLALLAGLGYLLAKQLAGDGGGSLVTVGNYIGQKESDARLLIEHDGLKADVTTEVNDQRPVGEVFAQEPAAGTKLEKGETVKLRVSGGKGQVRVPDVTGETLDDAQSRLADAGFEYRVFQETSDSVDPGKVTRTDPPAGSLADKGSAVKLYVSAGKEQVVIPDVSGQDQVEASNALGAKSLTVEKVSQASDTVDAGKVIGTNPAAGSSVPKGSKIQLIVSSGKEQVTVPNLYGRTQSEAMADLQSVGLTGTVTSVFSCASSNSGQVIAQSPSPGSRVERGSNVNMSVCKQTATTTTTTSRPTPTTFGFP
jgi:serine/threonine-protein kinase